MAVSWRPVGPLPASTYWLRRAVVAGGLLLLMLLVLWACSPDDEDSLRADDGAEPAPSGVATDRATLGPDATGLPTAGPEASPAGDTCDDEVLRVRSSADAETYRLGAEPLLTLGVRNTGATPCSRDLGSAEVELQVYSGNDRIWSSDDCSSAGGSEQRTLAPGEAVTTSVAWDGRRSQPGCAGPREPARAGTYRVVARAGELTSPGVTFSIVD